MLITYLFKWYFWIVFYECDDRMCLRSPGAQSQRLTSIPLADQMDSSGADHRGQPNGPRDTAATTAVTNGFHDADGVPGSDLARSRPNHQHLDSGSGATAAADQHLLNPGSAGRAHKGSTSSIPYIDCSDIDSEHEVAKGRRAARGHANDSNVEDDVSPGRRRGDGNGGVLGVGSGLFGAVNGFHHSNPQGRRQVLMPQGLVGNRGQSVEGSPRSAFSVSQAMRDEEEGGGGSFQGRLPFHSTLLDEILQGRGGRGPGAAGGARPLGNGTQSQCSSPVLSSFHRRTSSLSHGEAAAAGANEGATSPRWDDGGHYFSKRPGGVAMADTPTAPTPPTPPPAMLLHYGSYSPIAASRTPLAHRPLNNNAARNRSDTDPFILSQISSTPIRAGLRGTSTPVPSPSSAPTERRAPVTNGKRGGANLTVPGQSRPNAAQRLYGRRGKPAGVAPGNDNNNSRGNLNEPPVQMIDCSSSSGTDSSDTESDTGSGGGGGCFYASQPLMYGNPATAHAGNNGNGARASPRLPQSKFSFGSLQLEEGEGLEEEEEEEEVGDGCFRFTEEDVGGRVFSC